MQNKTTPTTVTKKVQKIVYIETIRVDKFTVEFEIEGNEDNFDIQERAEDIALEYMGNFGYDPNVEIGHGVVSISEHGEGTITPIDIDTYEIDLVDDNDNLGV
jgi:hypothetical protein